IQRGHRYWETALTNRPLSPKARKLTPVPRRGVPERKSGPWRGVSVSSGVPLRAARLERGTAFESTRPTAERSGDVLRAGDQFLHSAWNPLFHPSSTPAIQGTFTYSALPRERASGKNPKNEQDCGILGRKSQFGLEITEQDDTNRGENMDPSSPAHASIMR